MDYYNKQENLISFMPLFKKEIEEGRIKNKKELLTLKREICRQIGMSNIPKNGEILNYFSQEEREKYASIMVSKPVRVLSGVNVVAIMTKPYDCPFSHLRYFHVNKLPEICYFYTILYECRWYIRCGSQGVL